MLVNRNWGWAFVLTLAATQAHSAGGPFTGDHARLYASASGRTGFKAIPVDLTGDRGECQGVLFAVEPDGADRVLWRSALVAEPSAVYLHDEPRQAIRVVAVRNTEAPTAVLPSAHALVVYDERGHPIADYRLDQLLPVEEIHTHVQTRGGPATSGWLPKATCGFVTTGPPHALRYRFKLTLRWGRVVTIDLASGKLVSD